MKSVRYHGRDYALSANRLFSIGDLANLQRLAYVENALEVAKEEADNVVKKELGCTAISAVNCINGPSGKVFARLRALQRQAAELREQLSGVLA